MKQFTDEQKEDLRIYLKEFDLDLIEKFIHKGNGLLDEFYHVVAKQPDIKDYHYQMDKIINQVEKMKMNTQDLVNFHVPGNPDIPIFRNETVRTYESLVPQKWHLPKNTKDRVKVQNESFFEFSQVYKDALDARDSLAKLKSSLQSIRKKYTRETRGRKKGDHRGICLNVGYLYFKTFNKMPTTTKTDTFIDILKVFLDALKLPCNDPTRLIRSSIPELKEGIEIERKQQTNM
jgi:hypothetical protein